ncbi:MAG: family 16 glycoside hydrolase, partial [Planctomycetota bacterium]
FVQSADRRFHALYATHRDAVIGDTIAEYTFDEPTPAPTANASFVTPSISATTFDSGPGYVDSASQAADLDRFVFSGGDFAREALGYLIDPGAGSNDTTAEEANAAGDYFEFTLTADEGKLLEIQGLEITAWRNGPVADRIALTTSADGFANVWLPTSGETALTTSQRDFAFDLWEESFAKLDEITFRIIGFGVNFGLPRSTSQGFRVDDIRVVGRVFDAPLPGDFNNDGVVDAADYTVWRDQAQQFGYRLAADANRDGFVDSADYEIWQDNFGMTTSLQVGAVPEPTAWSISLIGWLATATIRRRSRVKDCGHDAAYPAKCRLEGRLKAKPAVPARSVFTRLAGVRTVAALLGVFAAPTGSAGESTEQHRLPLVDLSAWVADANPDSWRLQGNRLDLRNDPDKSGSILWSPETYRNFVLSLEFRFGSGTVDSGVFLRNATDQIQIGQSGSLKRDMTASPYVARQGYPVEAEGVDELLDPSGWNRLVIVAVADRYDVWLNGEHVVAYESATASPEGQIGLQLHPAREMTMSYRNVRLATID